jgi:hypothetical protein
VVLTVILFTVTGTAVLLLLTSDADLFFAVAASASA